MQEEITTLLSEDATSVTDTTTSVTVQQQVTKTAGVLEKGLDKFKDAIPSMLVALLVFVFGVIVVKIILRIVRRAMKRSNIDNAAKNFLVSFIKIILYINIVIIVLSLLKVPMSSVITIFGAAGLAVSLALQSCLSNLAGGFIILLSKPFSAGDILEIDGSVGKVDTISILYTKIITFDNKTVFIPNGKVSEGKIINYTESPTRRIDLKFDISYAADYQKARELILAAAADNKLILKSPEPLVRMSAHSDHSVAIDVLVWVNNDDYFNVRYSMIESVKSSFDENGIEIPFSQLDVHIKEQ
ncbi:mechanosensitive ion channel family protein [uncultured Ruminococcus sp.]|uniref:mechanosensitive ion channel family protein n=1 Tax=uncultured Ruminococcus sp. TaxID=165186 RepID=UPI0026268C52|nr:mechanosensitive ion channel domain-containing protein [uncultured Ruminococcus sp.]